MISTTLEFEQQITIEELLHDFDKYGVPIMSIIILVVVYE